MNSKRFSALFLSFLLTIFSTACGSQDKESSSVCPFTDVGWESTTDDVISVEGNDFSTYDSVYGGTCYTFPKEYQDHQGTIKYMFDGQDRLMCVAWACSFDDADKLQELYNTINTSVDNIYGKSSYSADHPGNTGNVWYLDSGDIVLSTMITSENKALQYAYLHPLVSNGAQDENKSKAS